MAIKTSKKEQPLPRLLIEIVDGKPLNSSNTINTILKNHIGKEVAITDITLETQDYLVPGKILAVSEDGKYKFKENNTDKEFILDKGNLWYLVTSK